MTEQLTDEERSDLDNHEVRYPAPALVVAKALRIIDAHAADRAALVAQLERSREAHGLMIIRCTKAEQVLSGEKALHECTAADAQRAINGLEAQVAQLQHGLEVQKGAVELLAKQRVAAETQVAELTRERDEARGCESELRQQSIQFHRELGETQREVTRLTEALAAAERPNGWRKDCEAAESRVRELEARLERCKEWRWFEEQLAAANALLVEAQDSVHSVPGLRARIDAHLAAQPATAPECRHCKTYGERCGIHGKPATTPDAIRQLSTALDAWGNSLLKVGGPDPGLTEDAELFEAWKTTTQARGKEPQRG